MGFRYPHIKGTRKYFEENADSAVRSAEAIPEHELYTLRARGKEREKNLPPPAPPPPPHNKRDVNPVGYSRTPSCPPRITQCVGEKPKISPLFFLRFSPFIVSRTVHKLFAYPPPPTFPLHDHPHEEIDKLLFFTLPPTYRPESRT